MSYRHENIKKGGVKKITKLKDKELLLKSFIDKDIIKEDIFKYILNADKPAFNIEVDSSTWIMPSRVKFTSWLDKTFKYSRKTKEEFKPTCNKSVNLESFKLFPHQNFVKDYMQFNSPYRGLMVIHGLGTGKCHKKDTEILMYDGSIKLVQDIKVGDKVMGDDSTPRKVLNLTKGNDYLYKITPTKGEDIYVNKEHILCLKLSSFGVSYSLKYSKNLPYNIRILDKENKKLKSKGFSTREEAQEYLNNMTEEDNILEISVEEYLNKSTKFKSNLKLYRKGVEFIHKKIDFDPYILGLWLGDGRTKGTDITNQDSRVIKYLKENLSKYDLYLQFKGYYNYNIISSTSNTNKKGKNKFLNTLRKYNMLNNKHIPDILKCNSKNVRLSVLAGLIDSDGHVDCNCIDIIQKNLNLSKDILYLCRSLGFAAYMSECKKSCVYKNEIREGTYYRISISGDKLDEIPTQINRKKLKKREQNKDVLVTGFKIIKETEKNDYYGFNVDKNNRYLLGNFTVTHNSLTSISAAEILLNSMDIIVMAPASLKGNYLNEIKKYSRKFLKTNQHWTFIPIEKIQDEIETVCKISKIDKELIIKHKGIWIPLENKESNYKDIPTELKNMIEEQIDNILYNRYTFINYNGLTRNSVQNLMKDGNIFHNKTIIIDEIHNLISQIVNKRQIASTLYNFIMEAKNCKIILLSGTPIINYPHEIAYIINLITGPRKQYEIKATSDIIFDKDIVNQIMFKNKYVDLYNVEKNGKKINLSLLPDNFAYLNKTDLTVIREDYLLDEEKKLQEIIKELNKNKLNTWKKYTVKEFSTLPTDESEFNKYFIDYDKVEIKNKILFMRRILGTVSYYNTFNEDLYPSIKINLVPLIMTDDQYKIYQLSRGEERKKENSKYGKKDNENNSGQVYRFYSRANCNFIFPKEINRPFPSKMSDMNKEIEYIDEQIINDNEKDEENVKKDQVKEYLKQIDKCLEDLEKGNYLDKNEIAKYSPKMKKIYENIEKSNGPVLIYSQFRKVEGLGIMSKVLKKNGYCEFKIKKDGDNWDLDISEDDIKKPKYIMFTGNNEETNILLKIFNNEKDLIPNKIRDKLEIMGIKNNYYGELIKVIMITQSGAEGISLKNVRQVHIVEPYWNHVRMDQVIGRAVRTCSHIDLKNKEDRHVDVFIYYMVFSNEQKEMKSFVTIKRQDKGLTTDEYIYNIAKTKKKIVDELLDTMKKASIDCSLNAKAHGTLKCFSFPSNIDESKNTFEFNITDELNDEQYKNEIIQNKWSGYVLKTKKGNFLIKKENNEVYDYDIYTESGKLVKLGELKKDKGKLTISFM